MAECTKSTYAHLHIGGPFENTEDTLEVSGYEHTYASGEGGGEASSYYRNSTTDAQYLGEMVDAIGFAEQSQSKCSLKSLRQYNYNVDPNEVSDTLSSVIPLGSFANQLVAYTSKSLSDAIVVDRTAFRGPFSVSDVPELYLGSPTWNLMDYTQIGENDLDESVFGKPITWSLEYFVGLQKGPLAASQSWRVDCEDDGNGNGHCDVHFGE